MRKLDFDLLKQRKIIFKGREYPVKQKMVHDEIGVVRGFRERYAELTRRRNDGEFGGSMTDYKREEINIMSEVIRSFCDIDADVLFEMPVRPYYAAHAYVIGGGLDSEALDADKFTVAGSFVHNGEERSIKAPSVNNTLELFDILYSKLTPAELSADAEAQAEALIDIAQKCVDMPRESFYDIPHAGLVEIVNIILASANGAEEENEGKNA
jgi:hypothetical protein